jgi:hypothetical protein
MASKGDAATPPERAPLLAAAGHDTRFLNVTTTTTTTTAWSWLRAVAGPVMCNVLLVTMALGAITGAAYLAVPPETFLVGLPNDEGLGAMLTHMGCYADLAKATNRRLVVVPQWVCAHYEDGAKGSPAMDYGKYLDLSLMAPNYLRWQDAPKDVRAAVVDNPDGILLANVMNGLTRAQPPVAAAAAAERTTMLRQFHYGPGAEDFPHVSRGRWEVYRNTRPCGSDYCDAPSFDGQMVKGGGGAASC